MTVIDRGLGFYCGLRSLSILVRTRGYERANESSGSFLPWNREPGRAPIAPEGRRTFGTRLDAARIMDPTRRTLPGCRRVADVAVMATKCSVGMRFERPDVLRPEHFLATVRASLGADQCVFHGPRPRGGCSGSTTRARPPYILAKGVPPSRASDVRTGTTAKFIDVVFGLLEIHARR